MAEIFITSRQNREVLRCSNLQKEAYGKQGLEKGETMLQVEIVNREHVTA